MRQEIEEGWQLFLKACLTLQSKAKAHEFFGFILTQGEREDIAMRMELVQALLNGDQTQREIAQNLGVSIAKITRGSNQLKSAGKPVIRFLKKILM